MVVKLAKKLRDARRLLQLTLDQVSQDSGVSMANISRLERGMIAEPGLFTVKKLADTYDVRLDYLLE